MWGKIPRDSDTYRRVVDAIVAEPDGQVAQWCDEIRQQIIERMGSVFATDLSEKMQCEGDNG